MGDPPDRNTYPLFRVDNPAAYEGALEELEAKLDYGRDTDPDSTEGRWLIALVNATEAYEASADAAADPPGNRAGIAQRE
jgi:hypothetical protein